MDIQVQVGDKITYKNLEGKIVTMLIQDNVKLQEMKEILETRELLKIERPKYEEIEGHKELLTEEEKEFLKQYIRLIESLNNGEVVHIPRINTIISLHLRTGLDYDADVGSRFKNIMEDRIYPITGLGL